jgi:hypothetical protein
LANHYLRMRMRMRVRAARRDDVTVGTARPAPWEVGINA